MQIYQHGYYSDMAAKRHETLRSIEQKRGSIYVKEKDNLFPLITNKEYYDFYAEPVNFKNDYKEILDKIAPILQLTEEEYINLESKLSRSDDPYEPIKNKIDKQQADQIKELGFKGLGFISKWHRYYPEKDIGGHVFGFVSVNDDGEKIGQYGLEGYFNADLSGQAGMIRSLKDGSGSLMTIGPREIQEPEDGVDIVLTIDRQIQYTACQKLKEYVGKFSAKGGTVIIMEPTGAILAMCNMPDFDPENFSKVEDIFHFNNPAIFTPFEPGSVFKMITMAAGVDTNAVNPTTTYNDEGEVKFGKYPIRNSDRQAHGIQTMTQVLEKSLNTGVMFVVDKIGKDTFKNYVEAFGFGKVTGIELNSEVAGNISALNKEGEIYAATASFGQGITATPLQLVTAFAAVANKGALPKPYIVSEVIHPTGEKQITQPQNVRQVISAKSASVVTGMLTSVVENSYSQRAKVEGYYIAGKSGTAQIAGPGGNYTNQTNHSFIGYGPITNPRFVMLVTLYSPQGPRFSESTSVPMFGELANYLINYYNIQPDY
jgi:cell division protein FtsI/penicillin-binding protein 2